MDVHARKWVTSPGAWISPGVWIALAFVLIGLPFLRLPGLHVDASSELACFYPCSIPAYSVKLFGSDWPLMILPYLGAFKGWLYQPLLALAQVSSFTVRLPLLLVAAGSVWMFFALLERTVGRGAAIGGALLLATDASFTISSALDFGPIVFLHFFLLAGALLLLRFERTGRERWLAAAFFLFGLATWEKALFGWMLVGLAAAAMVVFPRKVWVWVTPRRVMVAAGALCLGALPLVYYNVVSAGATVRTREIMSANAPFGQKALVLRKTMEGSALATLLTEENWRTDQGRMPASWGGRASVWLDKAIGAGKQDWMFLTFVAAVGLSLWLRSRAAWFAIACAAVTWAQMVAIPNTGAAMHHSILVWPWPHFLIAAIGWELARRFGRVAVLVLLVLLVGRNLVLVNRYVAHLETGGARAIFTDAVNPLSEYLQGSGRRHVVLVDWGYGDTLCLLSDGEMDLDDLSFTLESGGDAERVRNAIQRPGTVFVGRVAEDEVFPGVHARLAQVATEMGYQRQVTKVIEDRYGRPRFEVARYARAARANPGSER